MEEDQLSLDLGSLLKSGIHSDVRLFVKNQPGIEFNAHKAILASRSPVFAAIFNGHLKKKNSDRVEIADVTTDVLQQMLRFIYSNQVENLEIGALKLLLRAADQVSSVLVFDNMLILILSILVST